MTQNNATIVRNLNYAKFAIVLIGSQLFSDSVYRVWIASVMFALLIAITILIHTKYRSGVEKKGRYHWLVIGIITICAFVIYMLRHGGSPF